MAEGHSMEKELRTHWVFRALQQLDQSTTLIRVNLRQVGIYFEFMIFVKVFDFKLNFKIFT